MAGLSKSAVIIKAKSRDRRKMGIPALIYTQFGTIYTILGIANGLTGRPACWDHCCQSRVTSGSSYSLLDLSELSRAHQFSASTTTPRRVSCRVTLWRMPPPWPPRNLAIYALLEEAKSLQIARLEKWNIHKTYLQPAKITHSAVKLEGAGSTAGTTGTEVEIEYHPA
jgi:hypothetical protein